MTEPKRLQDLNVKPGDWVRCESSKTEYFTVGGHYIVGADGRISDRDGDKWLNTDTTLFTVLPPPHDDWQDGPAPEGAPVETRTQWRRRPDVKGELVMFGIHYRGKWHMNETHELDDTHRFTFPTTNGKLDTGDVTVRIEEIGE